MFLFFDCFAPVDVRRVDDGVSGFVVNVVYTHIGDVVVLAFYYRVPRAAFDYGFLRFEYENAVRRWGVSPLLASG